MAKTKATKATPVLEPEVVGPAPEEKELAIVETDADQVRGFLGLTRVGLLTFFREALALETKAKDTLAAYKRKYVAADGRTMVLPKTQDEDELVQRDIIEAKTQVKGLEAKWEITAVISRVHRAMTGVRGRGVKYGEEARDLAQRVHNEYADNARREAAREQERIRQAAEAKARADQEAEALRLDEEAMKAEAASADLSGREQRFVELVANGFNSPTTAARSVGYKNPEIAAERLMKADKIVKAIEAKRAAAAMRTQATAVRQQPVSVEVAEVKAAVSRAPGHYDKVTHGAEVLDERLFIEAVLGGRHGIPADVLTVNEQKLREYAASLQALISKWPGIRYTKKTTTV